MRIVMRSSVAAVVLTVLTTLGPVRAAWADDVVVFAAASLKNALDDASHAFSGAGGAPVKDLLCGQLATGQADRERRPGGHLHLGRSRLDGLPAKAQSDTSQRRGRTCSATNSCWLRRRTATSRSTSSPASISSGC